MKKGIITVLCVISFMIMHTRMYAQQYKYKKVSKGYFKRSLAILMQKLTL